MNLGSEKMNPRFQALRSALEQVVIFIKRY